MEQLHLYKVGASGRINLGELLAGVEFAQAEKNDDGTVTISPVAIHAATGKASAAAQLPGQTSIDDDGDDPY